MFRNRLFFISALFFIVNFLFRIVIGGIELSNIGFEFIGSLFLGVVSDLITLMYCVPLYLIFRSANKIFQNIIFTVFIFMCLFFAIGEFFFWSELTSRFNFIAVDYLLYTHEVIGNIRESYNMGLIITLLISVSCFITYYYNKINFTQSKLNFTKIIACVCSPILAFTFLNTNFTNFSSNRYANEFAKNGLYELFSAYRNNSLSFYDYYISQDAKIVNERLRKIISDDEGDSLFVSKQDGITRNISRPGKDEKHLNVVIITVESLSASYMKCFGNTENLTPNIDSIAKESLFFTNMKAVGTRTVYGLSAISLSIPPIPGNSIVRRPNNENLTTIGSVLKGKGYDCKFIYGGFGYFDNMNYFFGNNGYNVVDRSDFSKAEITHENIWGVCDEDLFNRVISEADDSYKKKDFFFSMVMTTSNHRPYTYPEGKIDIPSKTGRKGGVKYSDYAINEFIKKAQTKPWFEDTLFVIVADHTAGSLGKMSLDPTKHHIPCIVYSPKHIKPSVVNKLASQIDVAPTILGLLNMNYDSRFFGHDIISSKNERSFISNYQQIGYETNSKLCIFKPVKKVEFFYKNKNGEFEMSNKFDSSLVDESLAYFQCALNWDVWNKLK